MNFYDTNILLNNLEFVKQNGKFSISEITVLELENIKTSANKDEKTKCQARHAVQYLAQNRTIWKMCNNPSQVRNSVRKNLNLPDTNDGNIIVDFYLEARWEPDKTFFVTGDLLCSLIAEKTKLTIRYISEEYQVYKGYSEITVTNDEYIMIFDEYEKGNNLYNLIENQYLIIHCNEKSREYIYRRGTLMPLYLTKKVKALNAKQRCALDLLDNENIPIKVLCGVYGTGKTYLSVNVAVNKLREIESNISNIFLVRQPYGEGEEIGYLKGSKNEKIRDFFNPIVDNLEEGEFALDNLLRKGQLQCDIPFYMKGRNLSGSMVLVDEAEDLTLKQIKLLGSRIAEKSNIVFMGDWNQASGKYEYDCGLIQFINYIHDHPSPLVGVMVMDECVRSSASKFFSEMK